MLSARYSIAIGLFNAGLFACPKKPLLPAPERVLGTRSTFRFHFANFKQYLVRHIGARVYCFSEEGGGAGGEEAK